MDRIFESFRAIIAAIQELAAKVTAKPDVYFATVSSVSGDTAAVVIDGDDGTTPVSLQCAASANDRVTVVRRGTSFVAISRVGGDSGGGAVWGSITGTLSSQTDLQNALDAKANAADLAAVATSGSYSDLINTPAVPGDYVSVYGTDGIWTYRKWNSGVSECWGSISKTVTGWSQWGGLYEGNQNFQANYPSGLFTDTPELFAAPSGGLGLAGVEFYQGASNTQTPQMYLLRGNNISGSYSCKVNCHAIGRWK